MKRLFRFPLNWTVILFGSEKILFFTDFLHLLSNIDYCILSLYLRYNGQDYNYVIFKLFYNILLIITSKLFV